MRLRTRLDRLERAVQIPQTCGDAPAELLRRFERADPETRAQAEARTALEEVL